LIEPAQTSQTHTILKVDDIKNQNNNFDSVLHVKTIENKVNDFDYEEEEKQNLI